MAVQYWRQVGQPRRHRFVALDAAFHGETLAPTSLGGVPEFRHPFADIVMDVVHVPLSDTGYAVAFTDIERAVMQHAEELAAVVVEPMLQGAGGMRTYAAGYLRELRRLTEALGILLIVDEVFTGYGRTGPFWACEHAQVQPDILCTAKGFSGGMLPMAATLVAEDVFQAFIGDRSRAFYYGHTFCGNPLGAAVAREVLAVYRDERIIECAKVKAARIAQAFDELATEPLVHRVRHLGMMGALEFGDAGGYFGDGGWRVYEAALRRGAYIRPLGNVVYIAPALNIADADLDELLSILRDSIRVVRA